MNKEMIKIDEIINSEDLFHNNTTELGVIGALILIGCSLIILNSRINTVMSLIKKSKL